MAESPFSYYALLHQLVDGGFTSIEGKFGIAYVSTNKKWNNFGIQTCLIYGWGVPWLTDTYPNAAAYLKHVQSVLKDNYTGHRIIPASKAWQIVREHVEWSTGRRTVVEQNGIRSLVVVDESKRTFEQMLEELKRTRNMERARVKLYHDAVMKWSSKADADARAAEQAKAKARQSRMFIKPAPKESS